MPTDSHAEFADRVRLQIAARYRDSEVSVDRDSFSVRVVAPGHDISVPLNPLFHQAQLHPDQTSSLIAKFVATIESKLSLDVTASFPLSVPLWCVRSAKYMQGVSRAGDLLTREVGGDLVAFVAQPAPNQAMRGIPRSEWEAAGLSSDDVSNAADVNTRERFARLLVRIDAIDRMPADGWRIAVDELFCGSVLVIPDVLKHLAAKAGGEVLLANPDRSVVLAIAAEAEGAKHFRRRVTREWREAMNPCSRAVLSCDGVSLRSETAANAAPGGIMEWLRH